MSATLIAYVARLPPNAAQIESDPLAGAGNPGAAFGAQLHRAGLLWQGTALLFVHAVGTALLLASWYFLGLCALGGGADLGWLAAWALALASSLPLRALARWLEGLMAISVGGLLRQRLLVGAMALPPGAIAARGTGGLLGEVLESDAIDSLTIGQGLQAGLAILELGMIALVLIAGTAAIPELAVLVLTLLASLWLMRCNLRLREQWTALRLDSSGRLIENMTAHRTRLAQQEVRNWHHEEDRDLATYLDASRRLDQSTAWLQVAIPRGYLIAAIAALGPAFVSGHTALIELAVTLGGTLFAAMAFERLVTGFVRGSAAWIAWRAASPTFEAAATAAEPAMSGTPATTATAGAGPVLVARELTFTHPSRTAPVLTGCTLSVEAGDRVLLQGASGSGKSTLAALLTGLRTPDSGFILARGLDRHSLGDNLWRRRIAAAPQYHENHILSASLGFNLLLGRPFPHSAADLREALDLCQELGLGPLLERMPSGLNQMVGETGWRLSQGECSRVFLARALLQGADVVVLDESLAALDPDTLSLCLQCVMRRAPTLIVIAHP